MSTTGPRFIAIPVGHGDAFYLETPSGSVHVDGGRAISGFADMFARTTSAERVDIVICTHNDADHANGVIGFLQSGLECREVWLPGRWLGVLPHVLNPTPETGEALAVQAVRVAEKLPERSREARNVEELFESYGDSLAQEPPRHGEERVLSSPNVRPAEVTGGWPEALAESLERAVYSRWEDNLWGLWGWCREPPPLCWQWHIWRVACKDSVACALFLGALDAAQRIRQIAVAAYHRGFAVRWFEYTPDSPHGGDTLVASAQRNGGGVRASGADRGATCVPCVDGCESRKPRLLGRPR